MDVHSDPAPASAHWIKFECSDSRMFPAVQTRGVDHSDNHPKQRTLNSLHLRASTLAGKHAIEN